MAEDRRYAARLDPSKIELGAVFRFPHDDRPNRVLRHDGDIVMYDVWWPRRATDRAFSRLHETLAAHGNH
ncbi:hypothetical protein AWC05_18605 [Mycobacterium florentinum]|uniref:Uncharacterized protein n=1 Tax=Mycobacterium florentinum TaxID=292462 RepID=A0A1X1UCM5_MYCFL|nr:hypothetical protein AWC05_18605 [Mycobacterium florentinum]BBX82018.1 hypothetical protein MFLOJ_58050 [Mycobacterium florentinum]